MVCALLNQKIEFLRNKVIADEIGNHSNVWEPFFDCRATVSGESGMEVNEQGAVVPKEGLYVTVRYCISTAQIDTTHFRVKYKDDLFSIDAVDHLSYKHKALKFHLKKVK